MPNRLVRRGWLAAAIFAGAAALAGLSPAPLRAQASDSDLSAAPVPDQEEMPATQPADRVSARIKYLHDRLRITPAQEPAWGKVAQVMRENARNEAPLLKERLRSAQSADAPDNLGAYEKLGEAQLDGLKRFVAAFQALYGGLSPAQKKIADSIFRIGPLSMVSAIPQLAEDMILPEPAPVVSAYPPAYADPYPPYAAYPAYAFYSAYPPYWAYNPWAWGPPVGLGASFVFFHRFHHGFHHPMAVHPPGVPPARVGAFHHR
jgi:LTXXQ motif family protein